MLQDRGNLKLLRSSHQVAAVAKQLRNCAAGYALRVQSGHCILVALYAKAVSGDSGKGSGKDSGQDSGKDSGKDSRQDSRKDSGKAVALGEYHPRLVADDETQSESQPRLRVLREAGARWEQISEFGNQRASAATRRAFEEYLPELRRIGFGVKNTYSTVPPVPRLVSADTDCGGQFPLREL